MDTISSYFKENENRFPYNRSEKGIIQVVNEDNTVSAKIHNEVYDNIRVRRGLPIKAGDVVWVLLPKNSTKDMFVDDVIS